VFQISPEPDGTQLLNEGPNDKVLPGRKVKGGTKISRKDAKPQRKAEQACSSVLVKFFLVESSGIPPAERFARRLSGILGLGPNDEDRSVEA
jgi:hypothetical protein